MDKPLDSPLKDHNMNRDSNDNIPELLFSVDIKVEKEAETKDDEDWCVDSFAAGNLLEPLFFTQATEPKGVQCSLCFRYFLDRFNIYKHNLTHLQVTIINPACFQCDICNSFFANIKSIERHMPLHNKSITNTLPYKPKAWKYNTDVKLIKAYEEFTIKNSIIKIERKLSDGVTNSLSYRPKSGTRLTKRTHQCNICQKAYSYGAWHGHMNEVHGMGEYTCDLCDMVFKCQRYLNRHLRNKHFGKQPRRCLVKMDVKCDQCDAVLQNLSALTTHRRNVHSESRHVCVICNSTLKCKSYLLAHMRRVHGDGKKHECECGKAFKTHRYLTVHKRNAHSNKKKYKSKSKVKTEEL